MQNCRNFVQRSDTVDIVSSSVVWEKSAAVTAAATTTTTTTAPAKGHGSQSNNVWKI